MIASRTLALALVLSVAALAPVYADEVSDAATEAAALRFYEALNAGDPELFDAALAEGWVVHGTSPSLPAMDLDSYLTLGAFGPNLAPSTYNIEAMHVAGDVVTVRGTIVGTHSGPLFGVAATGRPVEFGAIDVHRVEGGEIAESWHVEDFTTLLAQIGGLPE